MPPCTCLHGHHSGRTNPTRIPMQPPPCFTTPLHHARTSCRPSARERPLQQAQQPQTPMQSSCLRNGTRRMRGGPRQVRHSCTRLPLPCLPSIPSSTSCTCSPMTARARHAPVVLPGKKRGAAAAIESLLLSESDSESDGWGGEGEGAGREGPRRMQASRGGGGSLMRRGLLGPCCTQSPGDTHTYPPHLPFCTARSTPSAPLLFAQQIIFVSRTHSQLSQFVGELHRTAFAETMSLVALGSRKVCVWWWGRWRWAGGMAARGCGWASAPTCQLTPAHQCHILFTQC
jgi:hypothetical protein